MHPDLLRDYKERILPNIEEPIREIVNALWELPFVVDTNEACCGHIVTNDWGKSYGGYPDIGRGLYWYPQGIRLGIDFSLESGLKEKGETFRRDISAISVDIGLKESPIERGYKKTDGTTTRVLHSFYYSTFPDLEPSSVASIEDIDHFIALKQGRLVHFWDEFADIVRKYNPQANISLTTGNKNFLKIIGWADLGDQKRYLFR